MHVIKHLRTVNHHRREVRKLCFKAGLYKRGLLHDLSKYSPTEFIPGAKFYLGDKSPQVAERKYMGYSAAWLHHKGRNKHHFEYWRDVCDGRNICVKMPAVYFGEMICDRVAACKIYLKDKYTNRSALEYFLERTDVNNLHEKTAADLRYFLEMLASDGEEKTFAALKQFVKEQKKIEKSEKKELNKQLKETKNIKKQ
ncbi:MAG: DUF5662 family protein [Clostridia bacterium]|nr:DUF5662 family protein [Clostridia bacterium]